MKINKAIKEIEDGLKQDLKETNHLIQVNKKYNGI